MSIKHKLLLSYSVIVLILIGISIYSIFQILHINKEYSTLMDERVYKVMEARKIQNGTSLQGLYLRSYVLRQSDKNLEMFLESRETALKNLEEIAPLFNNEEMQEQIQIIQEKQELYNQYSDKVIDHIKKGETGQALNTLFNYAYPANGAIQEAINHIVQYETEQMNVTQKSVTSGIEQSIILLIGIAIVAQEIRKFAEESKNSAEKIIGLRTQIQSGTKTVEESVNISVQNVDQGVSYLQEAGASFQSIFDAISEMSKRIEEISASVEELTAGTQEVAAAVSEMAHLAKLTSEQSDHRSKNKQRA